MTKRILALLLIVAMLLALTACNAEQPQETIAPAVEPPQETTAFEGGVLKVALTSASPFSGVLTPVYTGDVLDAEISYWMTEPVLLIGDDMLYNQEGAATYTYDKNAKTIAITMKPGVKWHDGEPVTMEDLLFAYEVLADPAYEGYFFADTLRYITGINDYNAGAADSIAGLVLSEDKNTLTINFDQFMPSILEGGLWVFPLPKHQLGGIAVADLAADERAREKAIGFGPFKIANVVPGETVELTRFDDYWQGKPQLDGVTISVVNPDMLPSAMERGLYDIAGFPAEAYADHLNPTNYSYLSEPDIWYQLTGFHLGYFDGELGENITDPSAKMNNLNLRKAIGHAVDLETICNDFYSGLRGLNPTVLPPNFAIYQNPDIKGYAYDPEKAKTLLDEAGYIDVDGDGFRENPDGSPLEINWAVQNNNAETVVQYKLQCWHDVGLNVKLLTGGMMDVNAYYDMLFSDSPEIDMFELGWILEESPKLSGTWGKNSFVNFTRFTSTEMDALLDAIDSEAAWETDYKIKAYYDFEAYFYEQAPAIPTVWRSNLYAVNNRVKNFNLSRVFNACDKYLIELTQDNPFAI